MKKGLVVAVCIFLMLGLLLIFFFFFPRSVPFSLVQSIKLPEHGCDIYTGTSFFYIRNLKDLSYIFTDYHHRNCSKYCKLQVDYERFDFDKYDYLIFFRRKPLRISHSPYLKKTQDDLCGIGGIPLIPELKKTEYDSIFVYKISKSKKYRSPGP
ncbi:MAG: hypothetical protein F082_1882 [bacterium F082]|nr:MAG: hypothetical protein F082_1882 [bacterium F082]KWW27443.1 MAG: hypothetical protein AUK64_2190 [bacterium P201]